MKPIIGITVEGRREPDDRRTGGKLALNWNYAQVIADAGGVPLIIPPMADMSVIAPLIHGWLIPGGLDIDAARFGEENHPKANLQDPSRYEGEERLYRQIDPDLPVLGICYGCQFINVVRGGSMEQHLPDRLGHENHEGGTVENHKLDRSKLSQLIGSETVQGRSYHHQAIGELGTGLRTVSKDADGVIEAVEADDRPWMIGVQWHPERSADDPVTWKLFEGFIEAAREYALSPKMERVS